MSRPCSINMSLPLILPPPSSLILSPGSPAFIPLFISFLPLSRSTLQPKDIRMRNQACTYAHMPAENTDAQTQTYTLIKQQFSGCLFSRYTSKIKSPAGENWGEKKKKKMRWWDQPNYKNNAVGLIAKSLLQCGRNVNGEKWETQRNCENQKSFSDLEGELKHNSING